MKEFVEKLIERLEEKHKSSEKDMLNCNLHYHQTVYGVQMNTYGKAIEIVNQLAEEYKDKYVRRTTLNQYMWERDTAISQLNVLGYGFGEKVGWIPCSERLPEEIGRYIVTLKDGRSLEGIYDNISKRFIMYENEVVAWMPMPQPYKPEPQKEIPTNYYTERFNRIF